MMCYMWRNQIIKIVHDCSLPDFSQIINNYYTYFFTYSMVQDILWKVVSYSACQIIACFIYGTRGFITVFTKARHWTLSWPSRIQFAPPIHIFLRSSLLLSWLWSSRNDFSPCHSQTQRHKNIFNLILKFIPNGKFNFWKVGQEARLL
jgi:hypothetical protein